jgi:hypothetical protein
MRTPYAKPVQPLPAPPAFLPHLRQDCTVRACHRTRGAIARTRGARCGRRCDALRRCRWLAARRHETAEWGPELPKLYEPEPEQLQVSAEVLKYPPAGIVLGSAHSSLQRSNYSALGAWPLTYPKPTGQSCPRTDPFPRFVLFPSPAQRRIVPFKAPTPSASTAPQAAVGPAGLYLEWHPPRPPALHR